MFSHNWWNADPTLYVGLYSAKCSNFWSNDFVTFHLNDGSVDKSEEFSFAIQTVKL